MTMTQEAGRIVASLKSSAISQGSEIHRALLLKAANQIESDQSKLAEREAELAKADAVVNAMTGSDFYTYGGRGERQRNLTEWYQQAVARHAARQQQKASGEPTERGG